MRHGNEFCARRQRGFYILDPHLAFRRDRYDFQLYTDGIAEQLPRHDIGVMLKRGDEDFITSLQELAAPTGSNKVYCLGAVTGKDNFLFMRGIDEFLHLATHGFVFVGGTDTELMNTTMDVGVVGLHEMCHGVDDRARFLRTGSRI